MTFVLLAGFLVQRVDGLHSRKVVELNKIASEFDGGDLGLTVPECGLLPTEAELFANCSTDKRGGVKFALIGDSKAASMFGGLVRTSQENARWLFIGGNSKNGSPVPLFPKDLARIRSDVKLTEIALQSVANNPEIKAVVVVASIRNLFELKYENNIGNSNSYNYNYLDTLSSSVLYGSTYDGLMAFVSRVNASEKKTILVVDNPALPEPKDCIERKTSIDALNGFLRSNPDCELSLKKFHASIKLYKKLLSEVASAYPYTVKVFDPTDIYCDTYTGFCNSKINGRSLYSYGDHISDYAAGLVGLKLNAFLNIES